MSTIKGVDCIIDTVGNRKCPYCRVSLLSWLNVRKAHGTGERKLSVIMRCPYKVGFDNNHYNFGNIQDKDNLRYLLFTSIS